MDINDLQGWLGDILRMLKDVQLGVEYDGYRCAIEERDAQSIDDAVDDLTRILVEIGKDGVSGVCEVYPINRGLP